MIDLKRHSSSTEPDRLKLIITIDEDEPIKVSVEAMTSQNIKNEVSAILGKNSAYIKEATRPKIEDCQISYRASSENRQRLLVDPLCLPKTKLITLHIRVLTKQYMKQCLQLQQYLDSLIALKKRYNQMQHRSVLKKQQSLKSSQMTKMTVLCGSPFYVDSHRKLIQKTANCLQTLKILYEAVKESDQAINLQSMQFNKKTWRDSIDSKILYIIAHAQDEQQVTNQVKGQTKWGSLELIKPSDQPTLPQPSIYLLILQTSSMEFAQECIKAKTSKNVLIINHNVLYQDNTVSKFISHFMEKLLSRQPLRHAYESAMQQVESITDDSNKLYCCCLHPHDEKCTSPKPPNLYTNYHYKLHIIRCKCQHRFDMLHSMACKQAKKIYNRQLIGSQYSLCCCPKLHQNTNIHSIRNKFQLRTLQQYNEYALPLTRGICRYNEVTYEAIKHCLDKMYYRATEYSKSKLAQIFEYKNQSHMKNKDRFIINLFGPKAAGKTYLIQMVSTIFKLKNEASGQQKQYRSDRLEQWDNKDILTLQNIDNMSKFKEIVDNCKRQTIIFIETQEKFIDDRYPIKHIEMKNLQPRDAYDLIVQLVGKKSTNDKAPVRKLNEEQKKLLKKHLDTIDPKYLFPKIIKEEAKKIRSYPDIQEYLKTNLKPISSMSKQLLQLYDEDVRQFNSLLILSQWDNLKSEKAKKLLRISSEDINTMVDGGKLVKKDDNIEVSTAYRINLQQTQQKYMKQPYGYLVKELRRHIYYHYQEKHHKPKQEVLFGSSKRNSNSPLIVFFRQPYWTKKTDPMDSPTRMDSPTKIESPTRIESPKTPNLNTEIFLEIDDIFNFLKKNYHSVLTSQFKMPIRQQLLCQQLSTVCILTISLRIDNADDYMLPIVKNINHLAEQTNQLMLSILMDLIQLQLNIYNIFQGNKTNNTQFAIDHTIDNIDNKIGKLDTNYNRQFFTAVHFQILIIEALRCTTFNPTLVKNCDNVRIRLKRFESEASHLLKSYNMEHYKEKKQFLRVLLCRNQMVRFDSQYKIEEYGSEFNIMYELIQDMLRHKDRGQSEREILQNIAFYEQLQKKYERILQLTLQNYIKIVISKFRDQIVQKLKKLLSNSDILTLMISYPIGHTKQPGVHIDYQLEQRLKYTNGKDNKIVIEMKPLNVQELQRVLRRGSRFICLWFEYPCNSKDHVILENQHKDQGKIEQVMEIAKTLPAQMKFVKRENCMIFVCGNMNLGRIIRERQYAKTVVNLDFGSVAGNGESQIGFIVERNTLQASIVNFFVLNKDADMQQITSQLQMKQLDISNMKEMIKKSMVLNKLQMKAAQSVMVDLDKQPQFRTIRSQEQSKRSNLIWVERWDVMVFNYELFSVMSALREAQDRALVVVLQCVKCFVNMIRTVYSRKNTFPGGIHIINWAEYTLAEPTKFLDNKLEIKLPILLRKKALIIMMNPEGAVDHDTTFMELMLRDPENKVSILWCSAKNLTEFNRFGEPFAGKKFRMLKYTNDLEGTPEDGKKHKLSYGYYKKVIDMPCECRQPRLQKKQTR